MKKKLILIATLAIAMAALLALSGIVLQAEEKGNVAVAASVKNGFLNEGGNLYYYQNNVKVAGWFTVEGVTYYASKTTNVVINYDKTIGGKYYVWNDTTGLTIANGFVNDGIGTKCYYDGYNVIGWHHADGTGPKVENGIFEQYSQNPQGLYYFLSTTGYMVTDDTYTLGGYTREFNEDHTVKPLNGLQTNLGCKYYYVNGVKQTGWQTIDGVTYYFMASDNVYGQAAQRWMYIGNKVYYFYASTSATPYALKTSGSIGGISYNYSSDGYIIYNGFINCEYANVAPDNTAANIQKKNSTTRYYVNGVMQTGWQTIGGNDYYFYMIGSANGSGYMCCESRTIGGVWYNFAADGKCEGTGVASYTVTFVDWDGTILKTEKVTAGGNATAPTNVSRDGYTFKGWNKSFTNVNSSITVTAVYEKITAPTVIVNSTTATGNTVDVVISLANNTGFAALKFDVAYGDGLTLTGVNFVTIQGAYNSVPEPYGTPQTICVINPEKDITLNGALVTLTFAVSSSATVEDITIILDNENIFDSDFNSVVFEAVNGSVTVK